MWTFYRTTRKIALASLTLVCIATTSNAQQATVNNNQNYGFNLPTPVVPNGYDEVRASDGTTCRSSISGNGAYFDAGGLAGQDHNGHSSGATVYGRVVIPLGKKPDRIDCGGLYQLEIERLKHELKLAKSGVGTGTSGDGNWSKSGWNNNSPQN